MSALFRPVLAKKARLRWDARAKKLFLVYPERGLLLDDRAAAIVRLCDGTRTVEEIANALGDEFDAGNRDAIARDVGAFVETLRARSLLVEGTVTRTHLHAAAGSEPVDGDEISLRPYTLIAELTYRCPLHCVYCSNPVDYAAHARELATEEWARVFGEAEALGVVQLHLTGGEPLARGDLEALVGHARSLGLYTNLITSGVPLTRARLHALAAAGLDNVQLSFQDVDPEGARRIAGYEALGHKREVARWVKGEGLPLTINVVLHRENLDRIAAIVALAEELAADRLELANTQYHGFAFENRAALIPSPAQLEAAKEVARAAKQRLSGKMEVLYVRPDYFTGRPKACMDGWARRFLHIVPDGTVLPCHAAQSIRTLSFESVRDAPLAWIWRESPAFRAFRGEQWMPSPCRSCDRRAIDFGGCRCQAFAITGDAAATDPACELSPHHDRIVAVRTEAMEGTGRRFLHRGLAR